MRWQHIGSVSCHRILAPVKFFVHTLFYDKSWELNPLLQASQKKKYCCTQLAVRSTLLTCLLLGKFQVGSVRKSNNNLNLFAGISKEFTKKKNVFFFLQNAPALGSLT